MIPLNRIATHPGVVLLKEYLEPLGRTQKVQNPKARAINHSGFFAFLQDKGF